MIKLNRYSLLFFICCLLFACKVPGNFIQQKDLQFTLKGEPYYFLGTNYWYGALLALNKDEEKGIERLKKELDFMSRNGITNVRVPAGSEGEGIINGLQRVGPPLQTAPGVFDSTHLRGMHVLLAELGKRNMTAVIYFSNNWNWTGGFQQYVRWHDQPSAFAPAVSSLYRGRCMQI